MSKTKAPSTLLRDILEVAARQRVNEGSQAEAWRYYDGHQETSEIREYRERHQMPDMIVNLIQEAINSVLGNEEQRRVDWMLRADDDDSQETAEALNVKINEVMRMTDANHACSEAYKSQIITGIGWVYFGRGSNVMEYQYECGVIHRREMMYDQRSTRLDMRDCRWVARRKYLDQEAAVTLLPEHEKLIMETFSTWDNWDIVPGGHTSNDQYGGFDYDLSEYSEDLYYEDWHKSVAIYDVYYRSHEEKRLIRLPNGAVKEYDPDDSNHIRAVFNRQARLITQRVPIMRHAMFVGPHMVSDEPSMHPHNEFPYVKLTGYVEDTENNQHYGLVRSMIGPQDAYNNANTRIHHLLNSKLIISEVGAFEGIDGMHADRVVEESNRADGYIEVNRGYRFDIETNYKEIAKLTEIKNSAQEEIRLASGISYSFSGQDVSQKSGVAIASLAEMSATTLAEINSNYQYARMVLGRLALAHLTDEIGSSEERVSVPNDTAGTTKEIMVNERTEKGGISNQLTMARLSVVLADAETSDGYRQQNQQQLMQIYQVSPPDIQAELYPLILESSNMPKRQEFLREYYRKRGMSNDEDEQQKLQEQQQQAQQAEAELAKEERQAKINLDKAQATKYLADAGKGQRESEAPQENPDNPKKMEILKQMKRQHMERQLH